MAGLHCILSFLVIDSRRISMSFIEFGFFPIPFHYITNTSDSSELKMGSKRILSIIPIDWHEFLLLFCSVMMNRVPSEGRWTWGHFNENSTEEWSTWLCLHRPVSRHQNEATGNSLPCHVNSCLCSASSVLYGRVPLGPQQTGQSRSVCWHPTPFIS